jgi:hypothetical protein
MLKQQLSPVGMDVHIQKLQAVLHTKLLAKWELNSDDYLCYDRCYRNKKDNGYIAEVFTGNGDYREVFWNDAVSVVSFFGISDRVNHNMVNEAAIHLVFFVNLKKLKPDNANRPDEEVRKDVTDILGSSIHGFTWQSVDFWMENVLKEYTGSKRSDRLKVVDMHPVHCFRINLLLRYNPKVCGAPTIVSAQNLTDGEGGGFLTSDQGTPVTVEPGAPYYSIDLSSVGDSVIMLKSNYRTSIDWGDGSAVMSYPNSDVEKTYTDQDDLSIKAYYQLSKTEGIYFHQGGLSDTEPKTAVVESITGTIPAKLGYFRIGHGLTELPAMNYGLLTYVDVEGATLEVAALNDLIESLVNAEGDGTGRYLKLKNQTNDNEPTNFAGLDILRSRLWEVSGHESCESVPSYSDGVLSLNDGNVSAVTEVSINGFEFTLDAGVSQIPIELEAGGHTVSWRYIKGSTTTYINVKTFTVE